MNRAKQRLRSHLALIGNRRPSEIGHARIARGGQSKIESLIALALFVIAALGAWILYGEEIRRTTRAMIQFFTGSG